MAALASQWEYPDLNRWLSGDVDADEEVYAVIALFDAKESKKVARTFFNQSPSQQGAERRLL